MMTQHLPTIRANVYFFKVALKCDSILIQKEFLYEGDDCGACTLSLSTKHSWGRG